MCRRCKCADSYGYQRTRDSTSGKQARSRRRMDEERSFCGHEVAKPIIGCQCYAATFPSICSSHKALLFAHFGHHGTNLGQRSQVHILRARYKHPKATIRIKVIIPSPTRFRTISFSHRFLTDEVDVWSQNAWDHVPAPDDQGEIIAASLKKQRSAPVPVDQQPKYNEKPARHWFVRWPSNLPRFLPAKKLI